MSRQSLPQVVNTKSHRGCELYGLGGVWAGATPSLRTAATADAALVAPAHTPLELPSGT